MNKKVLDCKDLVKKIGKKQILHNVSFDLFEGDILGFIGPNGAGKTTTIKLILGLQKINSGTVSINGFDNKRDFVKAIERVGAIVENPDLYMYLTGRENLNLIRRMYKNITSERIEDVIKISGLGKWIDEKVNKYSLGMRQRLGIAAAILHNPNLLILDEPTNGLDPEGIKELRELIIKLAGEEKMAILISSHNLLELENICNKVCIIQNGKIIETNSIDEIKRKVSNSLYFVELNTTENLQNIIKHDFQIVNEGLIRLNIKKEEVPNLVKDLVNNDYQIFRLFESQVTLEDAFLSKTGGNIID